MNALEKLKQIYTDRGDRIGKKAQFTAGVAFFSWILGMAMTFANIKTTDPVSVVLQVAVLQFLILAIALVYKKRLDLGIAMATVPVAVLFMVMGIIACDLPGIMQSSLIRELFVLVIATYISTRRFQIITVGAIGMITQPAILLRMSSTGVERNTGDIYSDWVFFLTIFAFCLLIFNSVELFVKAESDRSGKMEKALEKQKDLVRRFGEQMRIGSRLVEAGEKTEAAVSEMAGRMGDLAGEMDDILDKAAHFRSNSQNLIDNNEKNNAFFEEQRALVEETSAVMTEMAGTIHNLSGISESRKDAMGKLVLLADEGSEQISSGIQKIAEIADGAANTLEMVDVISDIAGMTNLLAMNAAIEAAHAGESGKGFAVVADEVRKLAESSAENASDISRTLDRNKKIIEEAVETNGKTEESYKIINGEIKRVIGSIDEILIGLSEMGSASGDVTKGVSDLLDSTGAAVSSLREISRLIDENTGFSHTIFEGITKTRTLLADSIDQFKTITEVVGEIKQTGATNETMLEVFRKELERTI